MNHRDKPSEKDKTKISYFSTPVVLGFSLFITLSIIWPSSVDHLLSIIDQSWYHITFIFFFSVSYLLIYLIKSTSILLDRRCRWEDGFLKRALLQIIFGAVCTSIPVILLCWLFFHLTGFHVNHLVDIRHVGLILLITNMMYGFYYHVRLVHLAVETSNQAVDKDEYRNYFTVPYGHSEISLKVSEIAYLFRKDKDVNLRTFEGISHPTWQALDDIQKELNPDLFFRLNRSHILNKMAFVSAERNAKKGLDVAMVHAPADQLMATPELKVVELSRGKVSAFKSWLKNP